MSINRGNRSKLEGDKQKMPGGIAASTKNLTFRTCISGMLGLAYISLRAVAQQMPVTIEEIVGKLTIGHPGDQVTVSTKYMDKIPFDMEYVSIKVVTQNDVDMEGQPLAPYVSMDIRCNPKNHTCHQGSTGSDNRTTHRLINRNIDNAIKALSFKRHSYFTNTVINDDRIIDRITSKRKKSCHNSEVKLHSQE